MIRRGLLLILALALFASGMALVTAQHRARGQFIELERLQQQAAQLEADGNRLRIELARAAQPASVATAARALGLQPIDAGRTVFLPAQPAAAGGGTR